jgi:hypothetical protein
MKTKTRTIILAVSCFLAGFITSFSLTRQPQPATVSAPAPAPLAMLTSPIISLPPLQMNDGAWYLHADGELRRAPPPQLQPQRYDLIDTRQ